MYSLILSDRFQNELKRLLKGNKKLDSKLKKILSLLVLDSDHPSLRLHKLSGQNNWSVSATRDLRIILHIEKGKIYLLRIGSHDQVY